MDNKQLHQMRKYYSKVILLILENKAKELQRKLHDEKLTFVRSGILPLSMPTLCKKY